MRVDWCVSSWFRIKNTHTPPLAPPPCVCVCVCVSHTHSALLCAGRSCSRSLCFAQVVLALTSSAVTRCIYLCISLSPCVSLTHALSTFPSLYLCLLSLVSLSLTHSAHTQLKSHPQTQPTAATTHSTSECVSECLCATPAPTATRTPALYFEI